MVQNFNPTEITASGVEQGGMLNQRSNVEVSNSQLVKLPRFYVFETRLLFLTAFFNSFLFVTTLAAYGFFAFVIFGNMYGFSSDQWYYLVLTAPVLIFSLVRFIFSQIHLFYFRKDRHEVIELLAQKKLTPNVVNIYRRLFVSKSNINWFSAFIYCFSLFAIFITFLTSWLLGIYYSTSDTKLAFAAFGQLVYQADGVTIDVPKWIVVGLGTLVGITFIVQFLALIMRKVRLSNMDVYFKYEIVPQVELGNILHRTNRRNLIIFVIAITLTIFSPYLIYHFLIKKRLKGIHQSISGN